MEELDGLELGVSDRTLHLTSGAEYRATVLAMARQARHALHIYTQELDPVFDGAEVEETFTRSLLANSRSRILVLVHDTSRAVREGHALVRLAQRLSSRVQIKVPDEEHRGYGEAFVIADVTGFIHQRGPKRYTAEANFRSPFEARRLLQYFEEVWERADEDPRLRRLFV